MHIEYSEVDLSDPGPGAFLSGESLGSLDDSVDALLESCGCNLGSLEGAQVFDRRKLSWMGRSIIGTQIRGSSVRPATYPIPASLARKAEEVIKGGFVGGKIGREAKKVQTAYLKRAKLFKKLVKLASTASDPNVAVDYRNKANKAAAKMIVDRARIERFRYVSLLKTHQVAKAVEADHYVKKAASATSPMERAKYLASAKAAKIVGEKSAKVAAKVLMTRIAIPAMNETIAKIERTRTATQYGKDAMRDVRREAIEDRRQPIEFDPPTPGAIYNVFGGFLDDAWGTVKKSYNYASKVADKVGEGVDWVADSAAKVADVAETAGQIATLVGPVIAAIPVPPVAQVVGGALVAAGAGVAAVMGAVKPGLKVVETIKDYKDKAGSIKSAVESGAGLFDSDKKGPRLVEQRQQALTIADVKLPASSKWLSEGAKALMKEYLALPTVRGGKEPFKAKYGANAYAQAGSLEIRLFAKKPVKAEVKKVGQNLVLAVKDLAKLKAQQTAEAARAGDEQKAIEAAKKAKKKKKEDDRKFRIAFKKAKADVLAKKKAEKESKSNIILYVSLGAGGLVIAGLGYALSRKKAA